MDTITIQGYNGKDKDITRDDFIAQWWENAQIWNLVDYHDLDAMNEMRDNIRVKFNEMAGMSWDLKFNNK